MILAFMRAAAGLPKNPAQASQKENEECRMKNEDTCSPPLLADSQQGEIFPKVDSRIEPMNRLYPSPLQTSGGSFSLSAGERAGVRAGFFFQARNEPLISKPVHGKRR
jgi:hypothetical protein